MFDANDLNHATRTVRQLGIPDCPPLLADLLQEIRRSQPDPGGVVRMIERDAGLAQALIAAVNSPLCGLRHKVTGVAGALTFGGLRYCTNVLAGFMLRRALSEPRMPEIEAFWERTAERALVVAYIARELGVTDFDEAHTFGLFRNCGIAVMMKRYTDYASWQARERERGWQGIIERERARYGIDHALIGGLLARNWCLPKELWLPVSLHHVREQRPAAEPSRIDATQRLIATAVLADCITRHDRSAADGGFCEDEQAYALQTLGLAGQELASLRTDVALMLHAP